jgi:hypothetical protein
VTSEAFTDLNFSLCFLRSALLTCIPAGPDGFEGLVATALASETGLAFRLASSGSQFGRDARSDRGSFSIAIEAKRYDGKLRLGDLAGKVFQAGFSLQNEVDLWVLGTTSEMSENVLLRLGQMLDDYGISLLALDWGLAPMPSLAVLIAGAFEETLKWFRRHRPDLDLLQLETALRSIRSNQAFPRQSQQLKEKLNVAEIGLDSLRARNSEWLRRRLQDRRLCQQAFGQYLAVSDPSGEIVVRQSLLDTLSRELVVNPTESIAVAIVGEEGIGKSWLVAQWLARK